MDNRQIGAHTDAKHGWVALDIEWEPVFFMTGDQAVNLIDDLIRAVCDMNYDDPEGFREGLKEMGRQTAERIEFLRTIRRDESERITR